MPEQAYIDGTLGVYEFNQVDLLRDVFTWAYGRSCQRFLAITRNVSDPDPLRIRYREALIQAIQAIVRGRKIASATNIRKLAAELVPEKDRKPFAKMAGDALQSLHEGSVARYKLKVSEFQAWKQVQGRQKSS